MKSPWKKISSKIVHKNPWWRVRQDKVVRPDGKLGEYFVIDYKHPSVFVVPADAQGRIILIKQFRYPTQMWSWEIVAGGTDGEKALTAAKRELWEETGCKAKQWKELGQLQSWNGTSSNIARIFLAKDLSKDTKNKMSEEGIVETAAFSVKTVEQMISSGQLTDGQSIAALTLYFTHFKLI